MDNRWGIEERGLRKFGINEERGSIEFGMNKSKERGFGWSSE